MAISLRAALARLDLLAGAEASDVDAVAALAIERRYDDGETIFGRGEAGDGMMVVLTGRIRLSLVSADGRELILREAEPGDVIGEIAVLDGGQRSADATALGPVLAAFIGQAPFGRLLADAAEPADGGRSRCCAPGCARPPTSSRRSPSIHSRRGWRASCSGISSAMAAPGRTAPTSRR